MTTRTAPDSTRLAAQTRRASVLRFLTSHTHVVGVLPSPNDSAIMDALLDRQSSIVFATPPKTLGALRAMQLMACRFYPEKVAIGMRIEHHWHHRPLPSAFLAQQEVDDFFLIGLTRAGNGRLWPKHGWRADCGTHHRVTTARVDYRAFMEQAMAARTIEDKTLRRRTRSNHVR